MPQLNYRIRRTVRRLLRASGPMKTRDVIDLLALRFHTTKQRISGNISFLVCKAGTVSIIRNYPNSVIY